MTIPISQIVTATPGVLSAGGNALAMNGLFLTENTQMPTGSVYNFASATAVSGFFGPSSAEAALAAIYFAGFSNSTVKPGGMLFAPYNVAPRAAFLQGASLAAITLAQLQAFTGVLTLSVNGTSETSATINLAGATSFSNAAALILAGFTSPAFTVAYNSVASAFVFTSSTTGTSSTITFATGSLAAELGLAASAGGFISQGAVSDTPVTAMANAVAISQNWATMVTTFEPTLSDKEAFAAWFSAQNGQYLYSAWDSDANASAQGNTTCFGAVAKAAAYNGVTVVSGDPVLAQATGTTLAALALNAATFVAGAIASINFGATNGRRTLAFLSSSAISPTCANLTAATNLLANGYNYYGSYTTAAQGFVFLYNGQMPGKWGSIVRYVNQIWLNSQFELALISLLTSVGSISYTQAGYGLVRAALLDPIKAAGSFGAFRAGVTLSSAQVVEVNQAAGVDAASIIQTQGYYLQVLDPGSQARQSGATPIVNFWYADGGDVLQISMGSIAVL